jgi:hypothetical protein
VETKCVVPNEKQNAKTDKKEETKDKEETYEKTKNNKKVFLNTTYKKIKYNTKYKNKTIAKTHRWTHHIKTQALKLAHIPRQKKKKQGKTPMRWAKKIYNPIQIHPKNITSSKKSKNPKKVPKK